MAGIFFVDTIRRALRERARQKRVQTAKGWPQAQAHVNGWKVLSAGDASKSFSETDYIEASFHFTINGEYYGGYMNSILMGRHDAEKLVGGSPDLTVRYNPANPDDVVVLAQDNEGKLPFGIVSG